MTVLGQLLPRLHETTWIVNEDRDGLLHDAACPTKETTTTRIHVRSLGELVAGIGYCPACGPRMLTAAGGVGSMLLRLTDRAAKLARVTDEEHHPAPGQPDDTDRRWRATQSLLLLLDGSNRAVPAGEHRRLRSTVLLPYLRHGREQHDGELRVLTAGDLRRDNRSTEQTLGDAVAVIRRGFLHHSPRGALLFYLAADTPTHPPQTGGRPALPGTLLETYWDPTWTDALDTMSMFGDEALQGYMDWEDPRIWWETAKLL